MNLKISNFEELATNELRRHALEIAEAGLQAIDTQTAVKRWVQLIDDKLKVKGHKFSLEDVANIYVVGMGKCSLDAATALEAILGDRITSGVVVDVRCDPKLKYIESCEGDHPLPTQRNIDSAKKIIDLLAKTTERDLVLAIVSGGGSTLLCQPDNMTCRQEADIVQRLFKAGAAIQEINTIRKHLSLARGGHLAEAAYPAQVVSIVFSDVPGDDLQFIASGPTVLDKTSVVDARKLIEHYGIENECGFKVAELIETPKNEKYFERVHNILFISNVVALSAMADKGNALGYKPKVCNTCLTGDAKTVSKNILKELRQAPAKNLLLYGGETTVIVAKPGKGGRNQEFTLSALSSIMEGELLMAIASDGKDHTPVAGAISDIETLEKAKAAKLDPDQELEDNNSHNFYEATGDHLLTGPTGSNVADLVIAIKS